TSTLVQGRIGIALRGTQAVQQQPRAPCTIWPPRPAASSGWPSIRRGTGGRLPSEADASQARQLGARTHKIAINSYLIQRPLWTTLRTQVGHLATSEKCQFQT